ncbi:MAG: Eco57I restriction-modification methylase domain-containing protein [Candidatus Calescibacterium sp.]|nr:Eco57I restriction-modification methylase domain-containing protein [Candidatus Calescibacterium sp.]
MIGNPPYVHFNSLPSDLRPSVKKILRTGEGDIYYAFIVRSIHLLKNNGELIYIVPYHFFYNTHAKIVRETILLNGKIELIIDLDETKLFSHENPEVIIFKFRKGKFDLGNEKITLLRIKTRKSNPEEILEQATKSLKNEGSHLFERKEIPHYNTSDAWSSFFFDLPSFEFVKLNKIAKVGVGFVSGFDRAFIIEDISCLSDKEKKLVKKFVKAKHCKRYIVEGYTDYVLIDDSIKDDQILREKYPNIFSKISAWRNHMEERYLPDNKKWFNWQALRNYKFLVNNLMKKRIYVPTLDRHSYSRFSLGEEGLLPAGDTLFIHPFVEADIFFLLGYLNSKFFRAYYLSKGGRRGGRIAWTQRLLENIEIPLFPQEVKDKIAGIVMEIINGVKHNQDVSKLENEIDDLINLSVKHNETKSKYIRQLQLF